MPTTIRLVAVSSADDPRIEEARRLLLEYVESLDVDLSFQNVDKELADFPAGYLPPDGALLLAACDERVAGVIAMRRLDAEVSEMKRLYVRSEFRGFGIGRELVLAVIDAARRAGYRSMRLDTLPGMRDAQRLYRALGFREITAYYENPVQGTRYMELDLRVSP